MLEPYGHLIKCLPSEQSPGLRLPDAAPLLEEERHSGRSTLVANATAPIPSASAGHPARSRRRRSPSGCRRDRLARSSSSGSTDRNRTAAGACAQVLDPRQAVLPILDADAPPDVVRAPPRT